MAGIARDFVRKHFSHAPTSSLTSFFSSSLHLYITSPPPLFLLLPHLSPLPLLFFLKFPLFRCDTSPLYTHYQRSSSILRYLRALTGPSAVTLHDLSVSYRLSASDHKGFLYPTQLGASKLPKLLRILLFGATYVKVDLVGSYQRYHSACSDTALSTVQQLRRLLWPCTPLASP